MVIEGLQLCGRTDPKVLAVVLHGWNGGPATMKDVIDATKFAFGALGIDVYAPRLPYAFHSMSSIRAEAVIKDLLRGIDQIVAERACYERIIVVGYSLGALIARRLFLVAAGNPPGFVSEQALLCENPRPWASLVDRLVTLGAFNRGWQVSGRMGWYYSFLLNLVGLIGHLSPNDWRPTIFDMRLGAPFIVQTRLHWLAYRRRHQKIRRDKNTESPQLPEEKLYDLPVSRTKDPIVVQLIGTRDNVASPLDQVDIQVDIAVDGQSSTPHDRRYFFVEMANTDHEHAMLFPNTPDGINRRDLFIKALTQPPHELHLIASNPSLLADDVLHIEPNVTDTVFIMHGIRDDGFWTHRIAKQVREHAKNVIHIRARTPTYGYFAMLPFMLPWIRRQKVEWLMDQYVSVKAQFPNTEISYVGHSNGTYLAARALKDYAAASFKHLFFAGSVVKREYDWLGLVSTGRVGKVYNVRASADWVVALLPKSVEWSTKIDLGGAGFDGFNDAGKHPNVSQPKSFVHGGHSAAIVETQWPHIARFILEGTVPPEPPTDDYVPSRARWLVPLANSHLGLLMLVLLFGIVIPFILAWPLFQALTGYGLAWPPHGLTLPQTAALTLVFVGYILLVKFVITRL